MPSAATVDDVRKLIWISHSGVLSLDIALTMLKAARSKAAEVGYPIVYDFRDSRLHVSLWTLGQYPLKYIQPEAENSGYLPAVHLISPDDNIDYWRVYERSAVAAGLKLKLFFDEPEAVAWLHQQMAAKAR